VEFIQKLQMPKQPSVEWNWKLTCCRNIAFGRSSS
jgi:hypothetical protein